MTEHCRLITEEQYKEWMEYKNKVLNEEKFSGISIIFDKNQDVKRVSYTLKAISAMIDDGCKSGMFSWGVSWGLIKEEE